MTNLPDPYPAQSLNLYIQAVLGKKAIDLVVLDLRKLSSIADVFIICSYSGGSKEARYNPVKCGRQKRRALGFARLWSCDHSCFL